MNRLPAFTLLETVLSLLLLAMLGAIVFIVLSSTVDGAKAMTHRVGREQELLFLCTAVRTDLEAADQLDSLEGGGLACTVQDGMIHWSTRAGKVHRIDQLGDTLTFDLEVGRSMVAVVSHEVPLVTSWQLDLGAQHERTAVFVKHYAPADIIRYRRDHGH